MKTPNGITIPVPEFQPTKWDLEILKSPSRFKLINRHRRSRKTTLAINKLIIEACRTPNRTFAYIGPTYKQAKSIVWQDPQMLKRYLPREILKKDRNESELYCEFFNGSILQIKGADDPDSLRGAGYFGVVLDEFAMMKQEIWEEILRPVLTENKGWAWFLFTPKGRNHAYQYWLKSKEWGDNWETFFLNAEESNLIAKDDLEAARKEMPELLFRQEFLCEFLEGEGTVFKGVDKCIAGKLKDPEPGARYVIGVDLAKTVDFTVLCCVDQITKRVVAFERFNQISWRYQKERIAFMAKRYNDALIIVDETGLGDPITEDLKNNDLSVEGFRFTSPSKIMLIERLMLAIEQRLILFPNIEILIEELTAFSYEMSGSSGNWKYSAPAGFHDDCVIALGLAVHGLQGFLYSSGNDEEEEVICRVTGPIKDVSYEYIDSDSQYGKYRKVTHPQIMEN